MGILARRMKVGQECPTYKIGLWQRTRNESNKQDQHHVLRTITLSIMSVTTLSDSTVLGVADRF